MSDDRCPSCGHERPMPCPPEPPVGTWVRDKWGSLSVRCGDGWAPAPSGFFGTGVWSAMWDFRGPLVECAQWGAEFSAAAS